MKVLIEYSEWLLKERGIIKPLVGDIVSTVYDCNAQTRIKEIYNNNITLENSIFDEEDDCYGTVNYRQLLVQIDYNPTESLDFLKWYFNQTIIRDNSCALYNSTTKQYTTIEELYKQFKNKKECQK